LAEATDGNTATRKWILYSALVALPLLLALLVVLVVAGAMVTTSVRTRRRNPTRT
jgi:hypothetical protein